jgi:hypothetical protein
MLNRSLAAVSVAVLCCAVSAPVAQAKAVDVQGTATCTSPVKAKVKAGPRAVQRVKTNVQIDDVRAGIVWNITVVDGVQTRTATATTSGASGSIDRDFFTRDNAGADTVTFTAARADGTKTCSGTVTVG